MCYYVAMKRYVVAEEISPESRKELLSYPPLQQKMLARRNILTANDAQVFLEPDYVRDIGDPFDIFDLRKSVDRILRAIDAGERICIYGDYDCDGIPGSVILSDLFQKIGYTNVRVYIPHRHLEGYGLHVSAIDSLFANGVSLLVTVDSGIVDNSKVAHAQALGMDVIITDHHLPQAELPPAYAVVNSKRTEDTYHDKMLCGAGVAWKLACAILRSRDFGVPLGWEKWLLDMAGLSTIADMVPLRKENRAIAYFGLKVLQKSPRPGLRALLRLAGTEQSLLVEDDVGFTIGPRINAASRMGIPMEAFQLLSTKDEGEANRLAEHLSQLNDERKSSVAHMMKEVKKHLKTRQLRDVIVIGDPSWRVGVVGLAANKIVEEYGKTAFVWGREEMVMIKGSCRSNGTVNLVHLMAQVKEGIFIDRGGHAEAGGFSVAHDAIHLVEDALNEAYGSVVQKQAEQIQEVVLDAVLDLEDVTRETYRQISALAPYGVENPKPLFLFPRVLVDQVKVFGKAKNHLEVIFRNGKGKTVSGIAFFSSPTSYGSLSLVSGMTVDVVASFDSSVYLGTSRLRLRIVDLLQN